MNDSRIRAPWLAALLLAPLPVLAQADCRENVAALEEALAGDTTLPPPQVSALEAVRETAAQLCGQGGGELANRMVDGALETLAAGETTQSSASFTSSLPKARLTLDYLAGEWCARSDTTGETIPHVFAEDGSYELGMAAGDGFAMIHGGDSIGHFRDGFDRLVSVDADAFVIVDRLLTYRYERGGCR